MKYDVIVGCGGDDFVFQGGFNSREEAQDFADKNKHKLNNGCYFEVELSCN